MQRIAIFDLDGTLLAGRVWPAFIKHHFSQKVHRHEAGAYLVRNVARYLLYKGGLVSRSVVWEVFGKEIITMLRGMDDARATPILETIYHKEISKQLDPMLLERWESLGKQGFSRFIISGSPDPLLKIIGKHLEATAAFGTLPEKRAGRYTGQIVGSLCSDQEKARRLTEYLAQQSWDIDWAASYSFADSFSDLPILQLVGNPTAVRPDSELYAYAQAATWPILGEPDNKI
ncbi:MAG: HAD-IB family hydrolase [Ardenticatenales bacterium]|nr:HAD-IB family hydrolase [Ardenticatenales bacterium]